jgi:hypothetical protein
MKQIEDKQGEKKDEPGLPVKIPLSVVRWLAYSLLFTTVLIPAMWELNIWWTISPSLILGHFASQLNALIKK